MPIQVRTLPSRATDWTTRIALDQFDPAGKTALGFNLQGTVTGGAAFENLEAAPHLFTAMLTGFLNVTSTDGIFGIGTAPALLQSEYLDRYDGMTDNAGTSGTVLIGARTTEQGETYSIPGAYPYFLGDGAIALVAEASARLTVTASGNFRASFSSALGGVFAEAPTAVAGSAAIAGGSATGAAGGPAYVAVPPGVVATQHSVRLTVAPTGTGAALALPAFDPSLGALFAVDIAIVPESFGQVSFENLGAGRGGFAATQAATVQAVIAGGPVLTPADAPVLSTGTVDLIGYDGTLDYLGSGGTRMLLGGPAGVPGYRPVPLRTPGYVAAADGATETLLTQPSDLAVFQRPGPVMLDIGRVGATSFYAPGNFAITASLSLGADVTVSYLYTPDPDRAVLATGFDAAYYLAQNPDVAAAGVDPLSHFSAFGWQEGRDPSAVFDTSDYLAANPDVAAARIDPLLHYILFGAAEGRPAFAVPTEPDPLVDAAYYYARNPDVTAAGVDAGEHYHRFGWHEGRNPADYFDTTFYLAQNTDVAAAGIDPFRHYNVFGIGEGREPSFEFNLRT